ncbi:hypothetical protein [Candidatus Lokiarchaeum ossiferum]|uniref:hypothetical protein n=1 Tax=Candidatus Lokiarchaeum ossiferum TaxID=2951803 RepID=UPI00352E5BF3
MTEDKIEEITKKFNSDLETKAKEIESLKAELSKRDIDERVSKIHSTHSDFKYEDSMSLDYLNGFIAGMEIKTKKHGGVQIPPIKEEGNTPKRGYHVMNYTYDEETGDQI